MSDNVINLDDFRTRDRKITVSHKPADPNAHEINKAKIVDAKRQELVDAYMKIKNLVHELNQLTPGIDRYEGLVTGAVTKNSKPWIYIAPAPNYGKVSPEPSDSRQIAECTVHVALFQNVAAHIRKEYKEEQR